MADLNKEDYNILKKIADKHADISLEELVYVYGKESSFGKNKSRKGSSYHGSFQFGKDAINTLNDSGFSFTLKDAKENLSKSAEAYVYMTRINNRKFDNFKQQYGIAEGELKDYSSITKNYLLHQQGANGLASILKTISTGTTEDLPQGSYTTTRMALYDAETGEGGPITRKGSITRNKMIENLTKKQKDYFIDETETVPEASRYFIQSVNDQLNSVGNEVKDSLNKYKKDSEDTSFLFPDNNFLPDDIPV